MFLPNDICMLDEACAYLLTFRISETLSSLDVQSWDIILKIIIKANLLTATLAWKSKNLYSWQKPETIQSLLFENKDFVYYQFKKNLERVACTV